MVYGRYMEMWRKSIVSHMIVDGMTLVFPPIARISQQNEDSCMAADTVHRLIHQTTVRSSCGSIGSYSMYVLLA